MYIIHVHIRLALTYLWTIEAFGEQALLKVSLFTILFAGAFILNIKSESSWDPISLDVFRDVVLLRLFPSIRTETVRHFLAPPIRGVVLQCYGAGNMPSNRSLSHNDNEGYGFLPFCDIEILQAGYNRGALQGDQQGRHHCDLHSVQQWGGK